MKPATAETCESFVTCPLEESIQSKVTVSPDCTRRTGGMLRAVCKMILGAPDRVDSHTHDSDGNRIQPD